MSADTSVRDGVIVDFNAAGTAYFGVTHPFTADAKWFDQTDQTATGLEVHILCDGHAKERITRNSQKVDVSLIAHVVKLLSGDTVAEVDGLVDLIEKMESFYYETERVSTVKATLMTSALQLPSRKMLNKSRRFYGWARLNFQCLNQN